MLCSHKKPASTTANGDDLIAFLLDAAPLYAKTIDCAPQEMPQLESDFRDMCRPRNSDASQQVKRSDAPCTQVTRDGCPECNQSRVVIDEESACLVCTECGLQGPVGLEHAYRDFSFVNASMPYTYKPNKYLERLMDCLEGLRMPRFPPPLELMMHRDFDQRGLSLDRVTPNHVFEALKRTRRPRFYQHRWAITHRLNPAYKPLMISTEKRDHILGLFSGCFQLFTKRPSSRRRKFYSYPVFLKCALEFIGYANVASHFKGLKDQKNQRQQEREVLALLHELTCRH